MKNWKYEIAIAILVVAVFVSGIVLGYYARGKMVQEIEFISNGHKVSIPLY